MGNALSVKIAALLFVLVVGYFGIRTLLRDDTVSPLANVAIVETVENFRVIATPIAPQPWQDKVTIRGRTKALRTVIARAQTPGIVLAAPTKIGEKVTKNSVLCRLRVDARRAQLTQMKAAAAKARLDYIAAIELHKEGLGSDAAVATATAALDLSQANLRQAELDIDQTKIRAPFAGIFDQRMAEVGDYLSVGDPCGVVIQQSPFLAVGAISERDVNKISIGDIGIATLATGEEVEGKVRFVANSADPNTRTFDVELEIPNEDSKIRDGVTAQFTVFAKRLDAWLIKRSAIILDDQQNTGIHHVGEDNIVRFTPVELLADDRDGVWVSGISGKTNLITRGQQYVKAGQVVEVVLEGETADVSSPDLINSSGTSARSSSSGPSGVNQSIGNKGR